MTPQTPRMRINYFIAMKISFFRSLFVIERYRRYRHILFLQNDTFKNISRRTLHWVIGSKNFITTKDLP